MKLSKKTFQLGRGLKLFCGKLSFMAVSAVVYADTALAAGKNDEAMKGMVDSAKSIFGGSGTQIVLNMGGVAAIMYALIGGFRIGPLIGGIGLLIFNALYFGYLNTLFA